jgi:hypothetical protein
LILTEINLVELESKIDMMKIIRGIPLCNTEQERKRMRILSSHLVNDQAESRVQDDIDEFIEEMNIKVNSENPFANKFIGKDDLFEDFKTIRKMDPRPFPKDLNRKKFWLSLKDRLQISEIVGRNRDGTSSRGFRIDLSVYNIPRLNQGLPLFGQIRVQN